MSVTATTRLFFPWISWTHHFPGRIQRQGFDALWRPYQSQALSAVRVKLVCLHLLGSLCRLHLYLRIIEASHEHIWTPDSTVWYRIQIRHLLPRVTLAAKVPGQRLPKNFSQHFKWTQFGRSRHAKRDRDGMFTFTFRWNMGRVKRMKRAESKPKRCGASQNEWPEYVLENLSYQ